MTDSEIPEKAKQKTFPPPKTSSFVILLVVLWALNLADSFQTLFLKGSGFLGEEVNVFINFFLKEGELPFWLAKILALILISFFLTRGWYDKRGMMLNGIKHDRDQVRHSIYFLLNAGVIYYIIIVALPFIALTISGLFSSAQQASL